MIIENSGIGINSLEYAKLCELCDDLCKKFRVHLVYISNIGYGDFENNLYIDEEADVCFKRIQSRGSSYDMDISVEFLQKLARMYYTFYNTWKLSKTQIPDQNYLDETQNYYIEYTLDKIMSLVKQ